jgi:hypothetical protein
MEKMAKPTGQAGGRNSKNLVLTDRGIWESIQKAKTGGCD